MSDAPGSQSWHRIIKEDLDRLRDDHLLREPRVILPIDAVHAECDGRRVINFSSNNYMGLTHHSAIQETVSRATGEFGFGSGAAPLITGHGPAQHSVEHAIAAWKGCESAILLPSGYQANLAAIQTLSAIGKRGSGVRFLADKLVHASLIDATHASGDELRIFPHNHIAKLARLLESAKPDQLQVVITESIFSMDGDRADLATIAELKHRHDFIFLLDEAHATGVYGPAGAGLAAEMQLRDSVDVSVITLSKAMGGIGGAVCGTNLFCKMLVNYARAYLFSTGVPAAVAAAAEAAVGIFANEPHRQARVRELARRVHRELAEAGLHIPAGDSPIVPIILGDESAALQFADKLRAEGLLVMPVRPPTVARGTSRLRITLCSEHSDAEVDQLIGTIKRIAAQK